MSTTTESPRDYQINVKLTASQFERVSQAAATRGLALGQYARRVILDEAVEADTVRVQTLATLREVFAVKSLLDNFLNLKVFPGDMPKLRSVVNGSKAGFADRAIQELIAELSAGPDAIPPETPPQE